MCLPRPYCVDKELHDSATRLLTYKSQLLIDDKALHEHYQGQKDEQVSKPEQSLQDYIVDDSPEYNRPS